MKTDIFIVTYKRDFRYLKFCVRSINKFASGFNEVVILFPETDWSEFTLDIGPEIMGQSRIKYIPRAGQEWPGKGFLWHEHEIMFSDKHCPDADFICHFDPDCIFTGPVTPETFIQDGKPILRYEAYSSIGVRHPGVLAWKHATESCLPFECKYEVMRCHPEVYGISLYQRARDLMELKTGKSVTEYIMAQKNDHPQTFAEFPTLGSVAMETFPDKYILHDMSKQANPDRAEVPVIQSWSHQAPDLPVDLWIWGEKKRVIPIEIFKEYGLTDSLDKPISRV